MKKLTQLLILIIAFGTALNLNAQISVSTIIFDGESQPPIVGGYIDGYNSNVLKKGVIVGLDSTSLIVDTTTTYITLTFSNITGYWTPSSENIYIDCSNINEDQFSVKLRGLYGNTTYFIKAFVITNTSTLYGETMAIQTQNFNRSTAKYDYANVWHAFSNSLFDLITDEYINPDVDGFYYSTNENPTNCSYQIGTSYNTCYKYKTYWNYELWYNPRVFPSRVYMPKITYKDNFLTISKDTMNLAEDVTFYYSINLNGNTPSVFTDIYSEPIEIDSACTVYCYGIKSDGNKSFVNMYKIYESNIEEDYSITVEDITANEGQTLEIPISTSELVTGDNIISYQFNIDYDNTTLEYSASDLTSTLADGGSVSVNSSVAGKLNISYMTSTAIVGAGDILKLEFNTLKADTTTVSISNAYLNTTEVTDLTAGQIIIKDVTPPTAAITYNDTENRCGDDLIITATFNEPMLETNAVKISLSGGATLTDVDMTRVSSTVYTYSYTIPNSSGNANISLSNGTDLWGNEITAIPTSGETFSIVPITYGDVDDDGTIFAYDAALTLQYSVGLDPLPAIDPLPWENWRDTTANVDGIGTVTANDAGMILQYSAGIITGFDASAKKSVSQGFISIEVINNEIILYSYGDLLGLNISAVNEDQILDTPVILTDNLLSAFNISGNIYKIGLCTTDSPENGVALMKIPFTKSGSITLDMIINTDTDARTLNLSYYEPTGVQDLNADNISIYPNPVRDLLSVQGLQNKTIGSIFNANGQMVFSSEIGAEKGEINVSALPSGLYILRMNVGDEIVVKRFAKE